MSQHPSEAAMHPQSSQPQKGWFGRNWKWFVPTLILVPLFCCCGVPIAGYFIFQDEFLKASPYYLEPMALVEQNDAAIEAIGYPIDGGKPDIQPDPNRTQVIISKFSVTGPDGSGMLVAEYDVSDPFVPTMVSAVLTIDSTNESIDLLDDGKEDGSGDSDPSVEPAESSPREIPDQT